MAFTEIAKLIIDAGADVNLVHINTDVKRTPLMLACKESHEDTVQLLLQSGADPNLQTDIGITALLCAVNSSCRSLGIVRSLLEAGAAVNSQDREGLSSLAIASQYGSYKIVELLKQYGANVQLSTVDKVYSFDDCLSKWARGYSCSSSQFASRS